MTGIGVRKLRKQKVSGYLQSKPDVTNLFLFPNPRERARAGNFPCFEFLPLWSRTYQPKNSKAGNRGCHSFLHVGPRLSTFPSAGRLCLTRGTLAVTFPAADLST